MDVFTSMVGGGLGFALFALLGIGHGYAIMGYRWSSEPATSLTGHRYSRRTSRAALGFYLLLIALGLVAAVVGLLGVLVLRAL